MENSLAAWLTELLQASRASIKMLFVKLQWKCCKVVKHASNHQKVCLMFTKGLIVC